MTPKRKKIQDYIAKEIFDRTKSEFNKKLYIDAFEKMTDKDFFAWIDRLESGEEDICMIADETVNMTVDQYFEIAEKKKVKLEHRLTVKGKEGRPDVYSPDNTALVLLLPERRLLQLLMKKIAIAKNENSVDLLTGQVTNESSAAKITGPELGVLLANGMVDSLKEITSTRGGDDGKFRAFNALMANYGKASQEEINKYSTGTGSSSTLKNLFLGAQLRFSIEK